MQTLETSTPKIIAGKGEGIGWLTFNQPEKRNAMSLEMWQGTADALDAFAADPEVRVVVMQGAGGKAFVSGADISQFETSRNNAQAAEEYARIASGARQRLKSLEKPLIAMIRGYCDAFGVGIDDATLRAEAIEWQATRGSRSGRVAWQYFTDLAGRKGVALPA